jgi:hypothetical protein
MMVSKLSTIRPRKGMDWNPILQDSTKAANEYLGGKRFTNIISISDYIVRMNREDPGSYPSFLNTPEPLIQLRLSSAYKKMGWDRFTSVGSRKTVFINPNIEEKFLDAVKSLS